MKKAIVVLALGILFLASYTDDDSKPTGGQDALPDQEKTDLLYLREEEKLGRDVYMYSSRKYVETIFSNFVSSEKSHMNSVLPLIEKYGLTDPIANDEIGVFANAELQSL